jgi:PHD/YefM family antitoxin component YafN of YafNO toxin-antitoxin module
MVTLHPEFVVDEQQRRKAIMLPLAEWEQVVEALEELDDIRAFDEAKTGPQEVVPFETAVREL